MKLVLFLSLFVCGISANAVDIASCSNPMGIGYFSELGLVGKEDSGWTEEKITGGITKLTKTEAGEYDIVFVDTRKEIISARVDGGRVALLSFGENAFTIVVLYPGKTAETYMFLKRKSGALEYIHTLARSGTGVLFTKASLMRGDCNFINFGAL